MGNYNQIKEKIRIYYLPWAIITSITFGLILIIHILFNHNKNILGGLLGLLFGVLSITIFAGGMIHLWAEYFGPKRISNVLKKKSFENLLSLNFKLAKEFDCYIGYYREYFFMISLNSTLNGESINIRTFVILPEERKYLIDKIDKKYRFDVGENTCVVEYDIPIYFGFIPKFEKIKKSLDDAVVLLKINGLSPQNITE